MTAELYRCPGTYVTHYTDDKEWLKLLAMTVPSEKEVPPFPDSVKTLTLDGFGELHQIPALPSGLEELYVVGCSRLTALPLLPPTLKRLELRSCFHLTALPPLPRTLEVLEITGSWHLRTLPPLPKGLQSLRLSDAPNLLFRPAKEFMTLADLRVYATLWSLYHGKHHVPCCHLYKRELVAAAFRPERVAGWLEAGGYELLETVMA
jgi:hypothetical protein